jgi:hypothetical protein
MLLSRFRLVALLLAFGLGMVGGAAADAAMAWEGPGQPGLSVEHPCPTCPDRQSSLMMPGCTIAACWMIPALPAQTTVLPSWPAAAFPESAEASIAGIVCSPDPHPPRAFPYS